MRILEEEINLREETRVAEQARPAIEQKEHLATALRLAVTQAELAERTRDVVSRILELPEAEANFAKDMQLLGQVASVMEEAQELLASTDTGAASVAAETEAIELLLQSRRINPNGGGGGGANPGGGGSGDTTDSALALLGKGNSTRDVREETGQNQATGTFGAALPEEFRAGIDHYFDRLEKKRDRTKEVLP